MARSLNAALQLALDNGGKTYWAFRLTKNTDDSWDNTYIVFGTLSTTSYADTTIWSEILLSCSPIDNSAENILENPLAKTADVKITIDNSQGTFDPALYLGRKIEIFLGYGTTMSIATSEVMFTGKIIGIEPDKQNATLVCRGKGELRNKEVGERLPDTVNKKYKGKVKPMTWGDWTDDDAYAPLIVTDETSFIPVMEFDNRAWTTFQSLVLYDPVKLISYEVRDTTQFTLNADKNQLEFINDTTATTSTSIDINMLNFVVSDRSLIDQKTGTGSGIVEQTIIKIDDELMLVDRQFAYFVGRPANEIHVSREYANTTVAEHASGSAIYQATEDIATFNIQVQHTFFPKGFSNFERVNWDSEWFFYESGSITNMKAYGGNVTYKVRKSPFAVGFNEVYDRNGALIDLVFEDTGISGTVINQYIIAYVDSKAQIDLLQAGSGNIKVRAKLCIDGSISEEYVFTVTGVTITPLQGAIYTNNGSTFIVNTTSISGGNGTVTTERYVTAIAPTASGTLTKSSGTGDATITFTSVTDTGVDAMAISESVHDGSVGNTTHSFDNVPGFVEDEGETDLEVIGNLKLSDISDLSDTRYSVVNQWSSDDNARDQSAISSFFQIGFRIDFNVSPIEYDFYARGTARKHPGSYFNGSVNDLMEAPSIVLEDFIRNDVPDLGASDMVESYFDAFHSDRSSWKMAVTLHSDMSMGQP